MSDDPPPVRSPEPLREFSTSEPSIARVWDFLLGGKDNFSVDRAQAETLLDGCPALGLLARQARRFQARAAAYVAEQGVRQFLDLGCGLPTPPNTHETVQQIQPGAVLAYVDNDELVLSHARARLATTPSVLAVPGDLARPDGILCDWRVRQLVDFTEPVCFILAMVLHFFDAASARRIVARLTSAVPAGSYLIVCTGQLDGQAAARFTAEYQPARTWHHTPADLAAILDGLDLTGPGITEARDWPGPAPAASAPCRGHVWAAVARKAAAPG